MTEKDLKGIDQAKERLWKLIARLVEKSMVALGRHLKRFSKKERLRNDEKHFFDCKTFDWANSGLTPWCSSLYIFLGVVSGYLILYTEVSRRF